MFPHWDGGWGVGTWVLMSVGMVVLWSLVAALVVWIARNTGGHRGRRGSMGAGEPSDGSVAPARPTARDILDERYARGEIGEEEYRTRRDTLASR